MLLDTEAEQQAKYYLKQAENQRDRQTIKSILKTVA